MKLGKNSYNISDSPWFVVKRKEVLHRTSKITKYKYHPRSKTFKCNICQDSGAVYTPNLRKYTSRGNPVTRDLGVYTVCTCVKSRKVYNKKTSK